MRKYLSDNVFAMRNWVHPCQELQKYNAKAINITFVRKLMGKEIFWVKISLQKTFIQVVTTRMILSAPIYSSTRLVNLFQ